MITFVIQYHPYRPGTNLGCKLVRRLAHISSTYSEVGASAKPGAVQNGNRLQTDLNSLAMFAFTHAAPVAAQQHLSLRIGAYAHGKKPKE